MKPRIDRRSFLQAGLTGLAGTLVVPAFLKSGSGNAWASAAAPAGMAGFLERFQVTEAMIREVMAEALSRGGDYCDLYFQHTIGHSIGLEDKEVNRAYGDVAYGVGIRVLKGDQTGYSFTEAITPQAMKLAARTAAAVAEGPAGHAPVSLEAIPHPEYAAVEIPWEGMAIGRKMPVLQEINDRVFGLDPSVIKCRIRFIDETSHVLIATSEGRMVTDSRVMTGVNVSCTAEKNGRREENGYGVFGRSGFELFGPENRERIASEAVRRTLVLFEAEKPSGGEMEVVLAPGSSGILLHEAIGHGMEADFNRKGISIFADLIGKPVAEPFVSIVDDGTVPNARGSLNVDDEGNDTQRTFLVENGVLKSYMHDRISARHYGVPPTGNGRRESFRSAPLPRMRCTVMPNGPHDREEIIRSVKKGLYAESFTNGEVAIGAGDFTFYVKSGCLIEDGRLTRPVKDVNIIGNGPRVLADIVMVGNDFKMDEGGWTCGKNGQSAPVSLGLPTVKVSKITVGGV
ncbi:MAG: TldD/PmbA family protein [bacterium]|nr:TldD/PmbA family protein [bacterium]